MPKLKENDLIQLKIRFDKRLMNIEILSKFIFDLKLFHFFQESFININS